MSTSTPTHPHSAVSGILHARLLAIKAARDAGALTRAGVLVSGFRLYLNEAERQGVLCEAEADDWRLCGCPPLDGDGSELALLDPFELQYQLDDLEWAVGGEVAA